MDSGPPSPDRPGPPQPDDAPASPTPSGPQAPPTAAPQAPPAPGPESPPGYQGPVPPGGWQQPVAQPTAWAGAPLSGWWSRVAAQLIDALILTVPVIVLTIVVVAIAAGSEVGAVVTGIIVFLAYVVAAIFYAPVLMKRPGPHNGQTWGKQAMSITVVRDTGEQIGLGYGFLREIVIKQLLFGFVGGFFFSIPTIINYLWPLWDDQNRALHDMLAKSHVIKR
jgi:uncharacterized RDD family membrane protein YckC